MRKRAFQEATLQLTGLAVTGSAPTPFQYNPPSSGMFEYGRRLTFKGRLTIGTAAGTAVLPEAPNVFRNVTITVDHPSFGNQQILNRTGGTIQQYRYLMTRRQPTLTSNPAFSEAVGTYDILQILDLQYPLENVYSQFKQDTLLDTRVLTSYSIQVQIAPPSDLVTPAGTTTFAWSAYGSNAGNPTLDIERIEVLGFNGAPTGKESLVIRTARYDSIANNVAAGNLNGQPLTRDVRSVVRLLGLKQYIQSANGISVPSSFLNPIQDTDPGIAIPQLFRGGKAIRSPRNWQTFQSEASDDFAINMPDGYGFWDFVASGNMMEAMPTGSFQNPKVGVDWGYGGTINGVANGVVAVLVDEVLGQ